ncbi:hypothetical protein [Dactylosporangium sp. CA-092794]|uniref:hypothetical protein n=1 Tax=Dactylosporangium sp. CA-092794 TaxID=3239929 RepID=UPI003D8D5115
MKNDPIIINEAYLQGLQTKYTNQVNDIDGMYGKVFAYGSLPGAHMDIKQPFTIRLGGANFVEAQDDVNILDQTRSGLAERLKSARGELYTLEYGIKFLLADSEATEQLSTLSAEQFEYFMPRTAS